MAIRIKARSGESAEQMMRRFKKLCEKEGLTKDIKRRAYYEKPSERKQRAPHPIGRSLDTPWGLAYHRQACKSQVCLSYCLR